MWLNVFLNMNTEHQYLSLLQCRRSLMMSSTSNSPQPAKSASFLPYIVSFAQLRFAAFCVCRGAAGRSGTEEEERRRRRRRGRRRRRRQLVARLSDQPLVRVSSRPVSGLLWTRPPPTRSRGAAPRNSWFEFVRESLFFFLFFLDEIISTEEEIWCGLLLPVGSGWRLHTFPFKKRASGFRTPTFCFLGSYQNVCLLIAALKHRTPSKHASLFLSTQIFRENLLKPVPTGELFCPRTKPEPDFSSITSGFLSETASSKRDPGLFDCSLGPNRSSPAPVLSE